MKMHRIIFNVKLFWILKLQPSELLELALPLYVNLVLSFSKIIILFSVYNFLFYNFKKYDFDIIIYLWKIKIVLILIYF